MSLVLLLIQTVYETLNTLIILRDVLIVVYARINILLLAQQI